MKAQPGDVLASVIHAALRIKPCDDCDADRAWMNRLGWRGCWDNRNAICARIQARAKDQGIVVDDSVVLGAIEQALRAWVPGLTMKGKQ